MFTKNEGKPLILDEKKIVIEGELKNWFYTNSSFMPVYYGGNEKLLYFIEANLNSKNTNRKRGKVFVEFNLDINGFIENPNVVHGRRKLLKAEALRVVGLIPRWQPGFQNGRFVKVMFTLPVKFK